jgi:hypothetical protein
MVFGAGHPGAGDLYSFYREWLGRPLPEEKEFRDMTYDVTAEWGRDVE